MKQQPHRLIDARTKNTFAAEFQCHRVMSSQLKLVTPLCFDTHHHTSPHPLVYLEVHACIVDQYMQGQA